VLSPVASRLGLSETLFEQAIGRFPAAGTLLLVQHRMHETIMSFPSERLYESKLVAHESVRSHVLAGLSGIADDESSRAPLVFWDTSGMGLEEERSEGTPSVRNPGEAALVVQRARALLSLGVAPRDIAVIAPYDAQVKLLREKLAVLDADGLEVDTVDGFQGREKEAVLVSLVRSNEKQEVGFLADVRRMNVALTRARRRLEVVGDGATIASHEFYSAFVDFTQALECWRSAFEIETA
jgi:superfamily I DNA and/or RNA helicase